MPRPSIQKSCSIDTTVTPPLTDLQSAIDVLQGLCDELWTREKMKSCMHVSIKIKTSGFDLATRGRRVGVTIRDAQALFYVAKGLLEAYWSEGLAVRLIGVRAAQIDWGIAEDKGICKVFRLFNQVFEGGMQGKILLMPGVR